MWILQTILKITPARHTLKFSAVSPCRYTPPPPPASLHAIQICGVKLWPIANCITRNNLLFAKSKECEMIKAAIMASFFTAKAKWWPSYEPTREKVHPSTHSARVKDADAQHTHSTGSCVTSPALQFQNLGVLRKMRQIWISTLNEGAIAA